MKKQLLINFTTPDELELHEFLRRESFETGLPMAEIMRQGLKLYRAKKEELKMKKLSKAEKAWEGLTAEEQGLARETLKGYAGSEGVAGRMWELYVESGREIPYGEYIKRLTEWDGYDKKD